MKYYSVIFLFLIVGCSGAVKPSQDKLAVETIQGPERILDFHSSIVVHADASLSVEESISVWCKGEKIRHGIIREIPTNYVDENGFLRPSPVVFRSVLQDGKPAEISLSYIEDNVRVTLGSENVLLEKDRKVSYVLRYDVSGVKGLDAVQPELYWNVVGERWKFVIDKVSVDVILPDGVLERLLAASAFTGPRHAAGTDYLMVKDQGVFRFSSTSPVRPREGFTVFLRWSRKP